MARIEAFKAVFPNLEKDLGLARINKLRYEEVCLLDSVPTEPSASDFSISNTLYDQLISQGVLEGDSSDGLYIYETFDQKNLYSGVWTLTSADDLFSGKIKKHELTFTKDELFLTKYRQQTGIEGIPVLLTYPPDEKINALIRFVMQHQKPLRLEAGNKRHCLWKVDDAELIERFRNAFNDLTSVYIADGHHRCAAVAASAREKHRSWQVDENDPDAWFSSLYMSMDQLAVYEAHRLVKVAESIDPETLFSVIMKNFYVISSENNKPVRPAKLHHFGMCFLGKWYSLGVKTAVLFSGNRMDKLDVSILNRFIISPAFAITDFRTNKAVEVIGGPGAMMQLQYRMEQESNSVAFTLCPLTMRELVNVGFTENILPPKSAWVEPKIPFGLLMRKIPIAFLMKMPHSTGLK